MLRNLALSLQPWVLLRLCSRCQRDPHRRVRCSQASALRSPGLFCAVLRVALGLPAQSPSSTSAWVTVCSNRCLEMLARPWGLCFQAFSLVRCRPHLPALTVLIFPSRWAGHPTPALPGTLRDTNLIPKSEPGALSQSFRDISSGRRKTRK